MRSRRAWIRRGLTVLIVLQLGIVFIAPVPESAPARAVGNSIERYMNFFEFTTRWSFFAPDPGSPPMFAEYELLDRAGNGIGVGKWPEEQASYFFADRQFRRVVMNSYFVNLPEASERLLVPWLCRTKKGDHGETVNAVRLWKSVAKLQTREQVASGERRPAEEVRQPLSLEFCKGAT
jgi:hypothetical protein